jgi:hypothetical protein
MRIRMIIENKALIHQQIEFFLLNDLLVNELHLIKNSKRITPACNPNNSCAQNGSLISRLFRSFLVKVFPPPFVIHKRSYMNRFEIVIPQDIQDILMRTRTDMEPHTTLQPTVEEIGTISFSFPRHLLITVSEQNWSYTYRGDSESLKKFGIGRYCPAVKAVIHWKNRLDLTLNNIKEIQKTEPVVIIPKVNKAQEELEAVIRAAREAGRL